MPSAEAVHSAEAVPSAEAVREAALSAERQAEAEDNFLLADTSGDGFVDEEELIALFSKLLFKRMEAVEDNVLARYLTRYRIEPSLPINLDFESFVGVYNSFITAQASGELARTLGSL